MDNDLSVIYHRINSATKLDSESRAELHAACESIGERLNQAERAIRDLLLARGAREVPDARPTRKEQSRNRSRQTRKGVA